jgi:hypothetical protein
VQGLANFGNQFATFSKRMMLKDDSTAKENSDVTDL